MAKKPSKTTEDASDTTTGATEAARTAAAAMKPLRQAQRDLADRIQPTLKLSELVNASEAMKAISKQRTMAQKLSELVNTSEAMRAVSAHQKMVEQMRANLQLPHLEALTKQATEAAAVASKSFAGLTRARDVARGAASSIPAPVEHRSALPSLSAERLSDSASTIAITSAHDLGQMVREAREQRKLSQQAFADLVGVGRRFISELENGKATLEFDKVLQVVSATGIDVLARRRR